EVHLCGWATGGPTMLEWLGIVRALNPPPEEDNPELWWAVVRAGYVALRDRLARLADPDFLPFPEELLDAAYHERLAAEIRENRAGVALPVPGDGSTSHLAVVDEAGNCITVTQTLLSLFGSGVTAPGTGVLLNNGMMWFDPRPGRPNSVA